MQADSTPRLIVVMGVSGVGKTTVGKLLSQATGMKFLDADSFHLQADLEQMDRGEPLTEEQRWPWIGRMHERLLQAKGADERIVLACSALRADHRDELVAELDDVKWVHLTADEEVLRQRLAEREQGPGPELLASQLQTLEPPAHAIVVATDKDPSELVEQIKSQL